MRYFHLQSTSETSCRLRNLSVAAEVGYKEAGSIESTEKLSFQGDSKTNPDGELPSWLIQEPLDVRKLLLRATFTLVFSHFGLNHKALHHMIKLSIVNDI
jgi:hypothetical protein